MNVPIIVVTGAECSGKTTLATQLSEHWGLPLVPEIARKYLGKNLNYRRDDLLIIAKQQHRKERELLDQSSHKIICDTDLLVIMIWGEVKFGTCDSWIYDTFEKNLKQNELSRHYLLCDYKIPWEADGLRENRNNRSELFNRYTEKIKHYGLAHSVVTGGKKERLAKVLSSRAHIEKENQLNYTESS
jgi:nicotinamide riboside kinase